MAYSGSADFFNGTFMEDTNPSGRGDCIYIDDSKCDVSFTKTKLVLVFFSSFFCSTRRIRIAMTMPAPVGLFSAPFSYFSWYQTKVIVSFMISA